MPPPTPASTTARHRALAHPSRVQLLELLRAAPDGLEVSGLAHRSGLHANTVRVHLTKLLEAELVTGVTVRHGGRGRPSVRYRATEPSEEAEEAGYRLLSAMLATALSTGDHDGPAPAAEAAGRRWGRQLADPPAERGAPDPSAERGAPDLPEVSSERPAAPDAVSGLFDRLGFAPEREDDRIVLHACPYRDLAARHPDVVCGLHLGLLRGALDEHGARGDDAWLDPFVTPTRCVAGLVPAGATPDTEDRP